MTSQAKNNRRNDLTGKRFGALTVLGFNDSIEDSPGHKTTTWVCRCDCGKDVIVRRANLANAKSCGCKRIYHISDVQAGQRFGKLTAVEFYEQRFNGHRAWRCKCDCGNEAIVVASELQRGQKSCGCDKARASRKALRKEKGHSGKTALFINYRSGARQRGLSFSLGFEDFVALTSKRCAYCNATPASVVCHGKSPEAREHSAYIYNGLDRVENDKGYELDNVEPCCSVCNYGKRTMSRDEFLQWIARVHAHLLGGK